MQSVLGRVAGAAALLSTLGVASSSAGTGLAFLKSGTGARAIAMGNAVVSHIDDPSATYWNPGAIAFLPGTQAEVTHNESFQDVRYESAALTHHIGSSGIAAAFTGVWVDGIAGRDETGRDLGPYGYYGMSVSGHYGLALSDHLGVGVGVEYLREQIDTYSTSGVALDLGVQARDVLPRTDIGASVLHLGSKMKYESEEFDLPMALQGGISHRISWTAARSELRVAAEVRKIRDEDAQVLLGTEYAYQNLASLNVGYQSGRDTEDVSMGFGLREGRFRAQYAFVPFSDNLGEEHRVSIRADWQ